LKIRLSLWWPITRICAGISPRTQPKFNKPSTTIAKSATRCVGIASASRAASLSHWPTAGSRCRLRAERVCAGFVKSDRCRLATLRRIPQVCKQRVGFVDRRHGRLIHVTSLPYIDGMTLDRRSAGYARRRGECRARVCVCVCGSDLQGRT
jgi:hypothetical protein